jgi:hypothetical protein
VDRERAPDRAALRLVCRVPAQAPDPVVLRRVCRVLALAPDPVAPVPARVACASGLTRSRIGVAELAAGAPASDTPPFDDSEIRAAMLAAVGD